MQWKEIYIEAVKDFIKNPTFQNYRRVVDSRPNLGFPCVVCYRTVYMSHVQSSCKSCPLDFDSSSVCLGITNEMYRRQEEYYAHQGEILFAMIRFLALLEV